jgi:hypothetical protein
MAVKNDQPLKQFEAFKATARALGCDEDKERFETKLRKIATQQPTKRTTSKKKRPDKKLGRS